MKAITLTQPWATAVAIGVKHVETRSWRTGHRGPIAIHAAVGFPGYAKDFARTEMTLGRIPSRIPRGAVVATARLVDCVPTEDVFYQLSAIERMYGDYSPGRWAWFLDEVQALPEPIPAKGALGLWEWPA